VSVSIRGLASLLQSFEPLVNTPGESRPRFCQLAGASESLLQLFVLNLLRPTPMPKGTGKKIIVILPGQKELLPWSHFLDSAIPALTAESTEALHIQAAVLPFFGNWGADRFINPSLSRKQRIYALALLSNPNVNGIVLTTIQGLAQKTLPKAEFSAATLKIATGDSRDPDEFCRHLRDLGYIITSSVEDEGSYAVRGGIVDVFPLNLDLPIRIEFMGDTAASIRSFSPVDQKSRQTLDSVVLAPAAEVLTTSADRKTQAQNVYNFFLEQQVESADRDGFMQSFQAGFRPGGFDMLAPILRPQNASCFDYLRTEDILLYPGSIAACTESYFDYFTACGKAHEKDRTQRRPSLEPSAHFIVPDSVSQSLLTSGFTIEAGNPFSRPGIPFLRFAGRTSVAGAPPPTKEGSSDLFDKWCDTIASHLKHEEASVAILANRPDQMERIRTLLQHRRFDAKISNALLQHLATGKPLAHGIHIGLGSLQSHLYLEDSSILIIPEASIFGTKSRKTKLASTKLQNYLSSFKDLRPGDLVVHVQHGIGRYAGMTNLEVAGIITDFLIIEYAANDKIYLPVDRLSLLQRYSSGGEAGDHASLDRLGGPAWEKRKDRVKGAVKDMAADLLKVQAKRALAKHYRYGPVPDTYFQFEAAFPYEETEDQLKALADIQADFAEAKPMDRLICGDVGFGKTEVALRATLRAVLEGFQVVVLVPTTVLCYQHFRTFSDRLSKIGIQVGQVSRFVDSLTMRTTIKDLESGRLDVLVGTHRVLSADIKPKKLGLIIVDEEQRFGVIHKEKLKQMRAGADVLTLTATPIPRTLHMAMLGLRDISLITTPPNDRVAIKTYVARFDETLIKEAIEREVQRGGQVFFVHNRVQDIEEIRLFVRSLIPSIDVRVAHGQMREHQLERVIVDFIEQKFPVLICTTIIESGIDMPNVNTLIVNQAERFGLAQLYQLRGRVGRSSQQAFAYLFTAPDERLSDEAKKRLEVLAAHQELGAGFQIASHDLEIRGAGNLLGGEQSGHVAAIGLELYTEMLDQAIAEHQGQDRREKVDTEIKIPVTALIPNQYVGSENHRLQFYKSLFSAENSEDILTVKQEVIDRYGPPPPEFLRLLLVGHLKRLLRIIGATTLASSTKGFVEVKFGSLSEQQIDRILRVVKRHPDKYRLSPEYKLFVYLTVPSRPDGPQQDGLLNELIALFEPLAHQIEN